MIKKNAITEDFIDNFHHIYQSDLNMMRAKLIRNDIPDLGDEAALIKLIYFLKDMSESEITEWKKSEFYTDYLQISGDFDPENDDSVNTNEFYLAGVIILTQRVPPEKIKRFFGRLNYYKRVYLSYKLDL